MDMLSVSVHCSSYQSDTVFLRNSGWLCRWWHCLPPQIWGSWSPLGFSSSTSSKRQVTGISGTDIFCVACPSRCTTVSKHWRKLKAIPQPVAWPHPFFVDYWTSEVSFLKAAVLCQYPNLSTLKTKKTISSFYKVVLWILELQWRKSELLMSTFLRTLCTKSIKTGLYFKKVKGHVVIHRVCQYSLYNSRKCVSVVYCNMLQTVCILWINHEWIRLWKTSRLQLFSFSITMSQFHVIFLLPFACYSSIIFCYKTLL